MHWIENGTFGQSPARGSYLGNIISAEREHSKMLDLVSQFLPSFIYLIQSSGFLLDRSLSLVFPDSFCPLSIKNPILLLSKYIVTRLWQIENIGVIKLQLTCIKYHWMTSMALMIYMNNFTDLITPGRRCMFYIISFSQRGNWHWETFRNFLKLFMDSLLPPRTEYFRGIIQGMLVSKFKAKLIWPLPERLHRLREATVISIRGSKGTTWRQMFWFTYLV